MKRFASVLFAVCFMLSLSVFSFASPQLIPVDPNSPEYGFEITGIQPYALLPVDYTPKFVIGRDDGDVSYSSFILEDDIYVGSGAILTYVGTTSSDYQTAIYLGNTAEWPVNEANYWWNIIVRFTDANGYVLKASDFNLIGVFNGSRYGTTLGLNEGNVEVASDNTYQFSDGFLQFAMSDADDFTRSGYGYYCFLNVSNSSVRAPISIELEKMEFYSNESSYDNPPFTFGSGAHIDTSTPPSPKDPDDHTQYGSASDQVEWYNDAYSAAVDPELEDKMTEATDMILQQEEIESQVIDGLNQYSSQVDPANLSFPTQILNGLSFIGTTFMGSYNALGDIGFVMSLSMMLGVVMVIIGRGEGALARGMSASARERRRTEYSSQRDMNKGG